MLVDILWKYLVDLLVEGDSSVSCVVLLYFGLMAGQEPPSRPRLYISTADCASSPRLAKKQTHYPASCSGVLAETYSAGKEGVHTSQSSSSRPKSPLSVLCF